MAVVSLVTGIVGVLTGPCLFAVPCAIAVLAGHFALRDTNNGAMGNRNFAVAGITLGYIALIPAVIIFLLFMGFTGTVMSFLDGLSSGMTAPETTP